MIRSFIHTEIFSIYIKVELKRIHKYVLTARIMHIFYEQAVCGRGTKAKKDNDGH